MKMSALLLILVSWSATAADFTGCTGNDTSALQAFVNANSTVNITCVAGVGQITVIKPTAITASANGGIRAIAGGDTIVIDGCTGCSVSGIAFNGNGYATILMVVENSTNTVITDNTLQGQSGGWAAIYGQQNQGSIYRGNTVLGAGGATRGLWIGNAGTSAAPGLEIDATIENNVVLNTGGSGIVLEGSGVVRKNYVTGSGGSGITISSYSTYSDSENVLVSDNTSLRNAFHGIQSDGWGGGMSRAVTLKDNTVDNNAHSGIYVANAQDWIVLGNRGSNNPDGNLIATLANNVLYDDSMGPAVIESGVTGFMDIP